MGSEKEWKKDYSNRIIMRHPILCDVEYHYFEMSTFKYENKRKLRVNKTRGGKCTLYASRRRVREVERRWGGGRGEKPYARRLVAVRGGLLALRAVHDPPLRR